MLISLLIAAVLAALLLWALSQLPLDATVVRIIRVVVIVVLVLYAISALTGRTFLPL